MNKAILILLLAIGFISCKKPIDDDDTNVEPNDTPAITAIGQTSGAKVEQLVGTGGGTITTIDGKISLSIPAGALESNQTISIQPIENKAPLGRNGFAVRLLPHGLEFKKNVSLVMKYKDEEVVGTTPELLNVATQAANGSWKKLSEVNVNKNTKTITASLEHFSDYSVYTSYALQCKKTESDTALIHLNTSQQAEFIVLQLVELSEGLSVPMPAAGEVMSWSVNQIENPSPLDNVGGFLDSGPGLDPMTHRTYEAPRRAPSPAKVTVSVKLNLGNLGQLFILRNVMINDPNRMTLNGMTYHKAVPSAIIIDASNFLSAGMLEQLGNKTASIGISLRNLNPLPGTYQFTGSEDLLITAHDEHGNRWSSEKSTNSGKQYTGNLEITISGTAPNRYIIGKITGSLFGSGGTVQGTGVDVVFAVKAF